LRQQIEEEKVDKFDELQEKINNQKLKL